MRGELKTGYVTDRELEVWKHVALGHQNRGIAALLGTSVKTVEKHRAQLMRKLGASTSSDVTRKAIEHGVIQVDVRPLIPEHGATGRTRYLIPQPVAA